ncbi:hypothetical protein Tco_0614969 [Tanacetum coccineum]
MENTTDLNLSKGFASHSAYIDVRISPVNQMASDNLPSLLNTDLGALLTDIGWMEHVYHDWTIRATL